MEDETLKEPWTWLDEALRLDSEPSSATPGSLWDDFAQNEAVVRSLFPASPHFKDSFESVDFGGNHSWETMPECNRSLLKRRRFLCSYGDDVIDACGNSLVMEGDNLHAVGTTSTWLKQNEDSMSSIHEDTLEYSTARSVERRFRDNEMSSVEESFHHHIFHPMGFSGSKSSQSEDTNHPQTRTTASRAHCGSMSDSTESSPGKSHAKKHERGQFQILKQGQNPVLAYPFALLKPSAAQGDLTLQDINQRINKCSTVERVVSEESKSAFASPLPGKSVVSCTKIYTEGKGTITIMKTRGE